MTSAEPEGPGIEISWVKNDRLWRVIAEYGDAKVVLISKSETGASQLETLVQGLPQILLHVERAQQQEEES